MDEEYNAFREEGRRQERERCAKIADERARIWRSQPVPLESKATEAEAIAHEIRSTK